MRNARGNRQLDLKLERGWGGRRKGAGRKPLPKGKRFVPHRRRPAMTRRTPVHVTWRVRDDVWNLRSRRSFCVIVRALGAVSQREGLRVTHFAVLGNHLHLIVEADETHAFVRGMKALAIRLAKGLNAMMGRSGALFRDRYHVHMLRTPTEVLRAIRYVLGNANVHARRQGRASGTCPDRFAAGPGVNDGPAATWQPFAELGTPIAPPRSWLLRVGWTTAASSLGALATRSSAT